MTQEVMLTVARLMELSAKTAPKAMGQDYIKTKIVSKEDLPALADAMVAFGIKHNKKNFDRDAQSVRKSDAVLLISLCNPNKLGLNCGACGYKNCTELPDPISDTEFAGPFCVWRILDLGIALGSAAKTAALLNADNRIMYRVGVVAKELNLIEGELVVGIPISATGKNIYFDR